MRVDVYIDDRYDGVVEFLVLPNVGDRVEVDVRTEGWTSLKVRERALWGYRGELPVNPRIMLRLVRV